MSCPGAPAVASSVVGGTWAVLAGAGEAGGAVASVVKRGAPGATTVSILIIGYINYWATFFFCGSFILEYVFRKFAHFDAF